MVKYLCDEPTCPQSQEPSADGPGRINFRVIDGVIQVTVHGEEGISVRHMDALDFCSVSCLVSYVTGPSVGSCTCTCKERGLIVGVITDNGTAEHHFSRARRWFRSDDGTLLLYDEDAERAIAQIDAGRWGYVRQEC